MSLLTRRCSGRASRAAERQTRYVGRTQMKVNPTLFLALIALSCGGQPQNMAENRLELAGEVVVKYLNQARDWNALEDEELGPVPSELPFILNSKLRWKWYPGMGTDEEQRAKFLERAEEQSTLLLEAAQDFLNKNAAPQHISALGVLDLDYIIVDFEEANGLESAKSLPVRYMSESEWRNSSYSPDYYSLTYPGLSRDGTVAVLYGEWFLHGLAANGAIEIYVKENGEWVISKWTLYPSWVS